MGDKPGHEFHGNQFTAGGGGGSDSKTVGQAGVPKPVFDKNGRVTNLGEMERAARAQGGNPLGLVSPKQRDAAIVEHMAYNSAGDRLASAHDAVSKARTDFEKMSAENERRAAQENYNKAGDAVAAAHDAASEAKANPGRAFPKVRLSREKTTGAERERVLAAARKPLRQILEEGRRERANAALARALHAAASSAPNLEHLARESAKPASAAAVDHGFKQSDNYEARRAAAGRGSAFRGPGRINRG